MKRRLEDYLLEARRGAFTLRTPFRRREMSLPKVRALAFQFARHLRARGLRPGDRMLSWGQSGPEWAAAFLGAMLAGVVIVPLDDVAGASFAARVQAQVGARLGLVARASMSAAREALPDLPLEPLEDLERSVAGLSDAPVEPACQDDAAPLEIIFTSGTTAEPKGVVLSRRNLLANLSVIERGYARWQRRGGWLLRHRPVVTLLPLSHAYGQAVGIFVPLMMGLDVAFLSTPSPAEVRKALREEGAFALMTVPRFLPALRREAWRQAGRAEPPEPPGPAEPERPWWRQALRHLEVRRTMGLKFCAIVVGGAALEQREERAWRAMGYLIAQGYGLTETAPIVTLGNPFASAVGSVGRPLPGLDLELSPEGEILVRGGNVTEGYWGAEGLRPVVDADGFFHTGDLGEIDERGRLHVVGRLKDLIVTAEGLNVWPQDVEEALRRDERVRDAAVIGLPGERGERVHAVLLLHGEPSQQVADDVARRANERLPAYQRMRSCTAWREPDFPRTSSTRKVKKRELVRAVLGAAPAALARADDPLAQLAAGGDTARLEDLGLSSLEMVELVARLEGELQVVLDDSAVRPGTTLADLRRMADEPPPPRALVMPRWARTGPARAAGSFLRMTLAIPPTLYACRPFSVKGAERLAGLDGPVLFIANHASYLDAPVVFRALPRALRSRVATAMATEPFDPLFSGGGTRLARWRQRVRYVLATTAFNSFPLPRAAGFRASLEYAGELADRGFSTLIFPEGRMTTTGEMGPLRGGIGLLAKELDVPVVPIKIDGLHAVLPPDRSWPRPGPVEVRFGAPLRFSRDETAAAILARLHEALRST